MIKLKNAEGILSTEVPTGNLVWVDQKNGNDKLAVRGRMTIPFRTLTAAKHAAIAGDTIMVLPGTYDESNLLRHQVNWHFMSGARVDTDDAIFDAGPDGTNSEVASRITGHGDFQSDSSVLIATVGNSNIYLDAVNLYS